MRESVLSYLCCPACQKSLELSKKQQTDSEIQTGELLCKKCARHFEIRDGLPNLVYPEPEKLPQIDVEFLKQYEQGASSYDRAIRKMLLLGGYWEPWERRRFAKRLELKPSHRVLEVGTGTGSNLISIAKYLGPQGTISGLDLSPAMLQVAREKLIRHSIVADLVVGNAAYLPYKSDTFDAVLHFGGINTFGDKQRAILEMLRVAKPGAKFVLGDEGLAPGKESTWLGRWLLKQNTLFANKPPIELIPQRQIKGFKLEWIWHGTFYVLEFRKAGESVCTQ
jgi:ubiquinone/menaquinone biosynthesis C-methylase UbiE/uncharacterized protein YbaR (Trm112 family)